MQGALAACLRAVAVRDDELEALANKLGHRGSRLGRVALLVGLRQRLAAPQERVAAKRHHRDFSIAWPLAGCLVL